MYDFAYSMFVEMPNFTVYLIFASATYKDPFSYEFFTEHANRRVHLYFITRIRVGGLGLGLILIFIMIIFFSAIKIAVRSPICCMDAAGLDHYVMEFVDLPSSLPSSSISIKVSMGKREYQTWEKGDFSFSPLASLREKLFVALYDAKGNEISNTGVEAISLVEKGLWDDFFPIEGGGLVHLKLQFVLTEEERNRVRMMRESASKKKRNELLYNSPQRRQDIARTTSYTAAPFLAQNPEVSDTSQVTSFTVPVPVGINSSEVYTQEFGKIVEPQSRSIDGSMDPKENSIIFTSTDKSDVSSPPPMPQRIDDRKSVDVDKPQSPFADESMNPKEVFTLERSSNASELTSFLALDRTIYPSEVSIPVLRLDESEAISYNETEVPSQGLLVKVTETQSPSVDRLVNPNEASSVISTTATIPQEIETRSYSTDESMYGKEVLPPPRSSELAILAKKKIIPLETEAGQSQKPKKQVPLERTPSSVKRMISTFESSQPQVIPATIKSSSIKLGAVALLKNPQRKEMELETTKLTEEEPEKVKNPLFKEELEQMIAFFKKRKEQLNRNEALDASKSSHHIKQFRKGKLIFKNPIPIFEDEPKSHDVVQDPKISGQMLDEALFRNQPSVIDRADSGDREVNSNELHEQETESPEVMLAPTVKEAAISVQVLDDYLDDQQSTDSLTNRKDSKGTSAIMGSNSTETNPNMAMKEDATNSTQNLRESSWAATDSLISLGSDEDKKYSCRSSRTWIFPEEAIQSCTTASTSCSAEATTWRGRISFSASQEQEHRLHADKTLSTPRESEIDDSAEAGNCKRPIRQAIKFAIIVGFGTLILLGQIKIR